MDLISLDGLPYPAMPPEVRVATMLAKYAVFGIVPEVVPTIMPDIPIPVERIPTQKGTDLAYINRSPKRPATSSTSIPARCPA